VQTSERMRRRTARVPLNRLGFPICGTGRRTLITSMMSLESGAQPEDSRAFLRPGDSTKSRDHTGLISNLELLVTLYIAIIYIAQYLSYSSPRVFSVCL
jgi:hypothetical protein